MSNFWKIATTSKVLASAAIAIWLGSLALPVFMTPNGNADSGIAYLAIGWLGLLRLHPGWLANPLLLYSALSVFRRKKTPMSALGAVVIAVTTVLAGVQPNSAIDSQQFEAVVAVGWGAVLWMLSTTVALAAQGTLSKESLESTNFKLLYAKALRLVGILASVTIVAYTLTLWKQDRTGTAVAESERLSGMAYKVGEVCRLNPPVSKVRAKKLAGPLEFRHDPAHRSIEHPFEHAAQMLDMGVPSYRLRGRDFSYEVLGGEKMMVSVPPSKSSVATLSAWEDRYGRTEIRRIRLVENETGQVIYDHKSDQEALGYSFCPAFPPKSIGNGGSYEFLADSIQLESRPTHRNKFFYDLSRKSVGSVRSESQDLDFANERRLMQDMRTTSPMRELSSALTNRNCPETIGWKRDPPLRPFFIGEKAFYPAALGARDQSYCAPNNIYIYSTTLSGDSQLFVSIEKRSRVDFSVSSRDSITLDGTGKWKDADQLHVLSVTDESAISKIILGRESDGTVFEINLAPKSAVK